MITLLYQILLITIDFWMENTKEKELPSESPILNRSFSAHSFNSFGEVWICHEFLFPPTKNSVASVPKTFIENNIRQVVKHKNKDFELILSK